MLQAKKQPKAGWFLFLYLRLKITSVRTLHAQRILHTQQSFPFLPSQTLLLKWGWEEQTRQQQNTASQTFCYSKSSEDGIRWSIAALGILKILPFISQKSSLAGENIVEITVKYSDDRRGGKRKDASRHQSVNAWHHIFWKLCKISWAFRNYKCCRSGFSPFITDKDGMWRRRGIPFYWYPVVRFQVLPWFP